MRHSPNPRPAFGLVMDDKIFAGITSCGIHVAYLTICVILVAQTARVGEEERIIIIFG